MYFDEERRSDVQQFEGAILNKTTSTTASLRISIGEVLEGSVPDSHFFTKTVFQEEHDVLRAALDSLGNKAITFSAVRGFLDADSGACLSGDIRRLISSLYTRHYMTQTAADIPTGFWGLEYYDSISKSFPIYDIPVLLELTSKLFRKSSQGKWDDARWQAIVERRYSEMHIEFSREIERFLLALLFASQSGVRKTHLAIRDAVLGTLRSDMQFGRIDLLDDTGFASAWKFLRDHVEKLQRAKGGFKEAVDMADTFLKDGATKIILATATDVEDEVLRESMSRRGILPEVKVRDKGAYGLYRFRNDVDVYWVRSSMGSGGSGGSGLSMLDAIDEICPRYVISCGIAFGKSADKQKMGDILVSESVRMYECQRVGADRTVARGERPNAFPSLVQLARVTALQLGLKSIHTGLILSGDKLVDNPELKARLWEMEPEAIGGEMEAAGVVAACHRRQVPWIVIKAICDWGENKGNADQRLAAVNAMGFVLEMLDYSFAVFLPDIVES